jgi:hypothetical protein
MESSDNKVCAASDLEVQSDAVPSEPTLRGMKIPETAHRYEVVADGSRFGIAFRGEVKIHGMELNRARATVLILNAVQEMEEEALPQ